ncbi:UDP-glycosyltransferase 74C1 OS=Arabidopsis thaliana GN=UGT74C1 PE=2 SV=1 [Rhizoctonia solani AG-1 IB]|uniref:UDP-glycosyltransferase 74C1 n=1 Tax=Thanatephorus cucumeris (strain AG1-IB / isolate 7/3/14) TaxID=1108050 RepID=A0A0B7FRN9_THACB|nr:UDP-glycosyltransferase 74C1 OS=Arabidopsis thaliana GN=UGT74C1 PE=2 SV=1 [Rhizoctonia solani AG-1 IB]
MYSKRIRVVTALTEEAGLPMSADNIMALLNHMETCFKIWISSELKQASVIQVEGHPVGVPSLVIEDLFNGGMSLECKEVHNIPVAGWWITPASSLMTFTGHEETSKKTVYDALAHIDASQEDFFTEANKLYLQNVSDRLVSIPGLPAVYEWELNPQSVSFIPPFMAYLIPRVSNLLKHVATLILCTTFEMEPISSSSLSSAFNSPIESFFVGPSVDLSPPHQPDPESPVTQFLDRAYNEKGAHSVVYVAFGTAFFPLPESMTHLMAAVDEIVNSGFRFVFALSSANAKLDKSWMDAHIEAGNAVFPEWTNQTAVLEHPAIHYFLSHGGWNSSTEALVRGVPMIFWPFIGDQPTNSMLIATIHDCGFELLQVRTGPAKSKAYRSDSATKIVGTDDAVREEMKRILELSNGTRGAHQRANARALGKVITDSLVREGSGEVALRKLGNVLGLA